MTWTLCRFIWCWLSSQNVWITEMPLICISSSSPLRRLNTKSFPALRPQGLPGPCVLSSLCPFIQAVSLASTQTSVFNCHINCFGITAWYRIRGRTRQARAAVTRLSDYLLVDGRIYNNSSESTSAWRQRCDWTRQGWDRRCVTDICSLQFIC